LNFQEKGSAEVLHPATGWVNCSVEGQSINLEEENVKRGKWYRNQKNTPSGGKKRKKNKRRKKLMEKSVVSGKKKAETTLAHDQNSRRKKL